MSRTNEFRISITDERICPSYKNIIVDYFGFYFYNKLLNLHKNCELTKLVTNILFHWHFL